MSTSVDRIVEALNGPRGDARSFSIMLPGSYRLIDVGKIIDAVFARTKKAISLSVRSSSKDETGGEQTWVQVTVH